MIRKANSQDIKHIYKIYQDLSLDSDSIYDEEYLQSIQKDGFFLGEDTLEEFKNSLDNSYYSTVYTEKSNVEGFLIASLEGKFVDDSRKTWFDIEYKDYYYSDETVIISNIGVVKNAAGKGIGTQLLRDLEIKMQEDGFQYLFATITISPIINLASLKFHIKNGFHPIATLAPIDWCLNNYSPLLLGKCV